mmetsp:Transcript_10787/g.16064  ORF Transcript_10787/g.16064 Transcript_10787/m.16064 type:complete len:121 (-) Transcript_10787:123-485(-)
MASVVPPEAPAQDTMSVSNGEGAESLGKSVDGAQSAYVLDLEGKIIERWSESKGKAQGEKKMGEDILQLLQCVGGLLKAGEFSTEPLKRVTVTAGSRQFRITMDSKRIYVVSTKIKKTSK